MRTIVFPLLLGLGLVAGCSKAADKDGSSAARAQVAPVPPRSIAEVTVDQLDHMLADHACQAVDANGTPTRKQMGVIPGAVLLTDMDQLDNLPSDKATNLVFYCANTACDASHYAAEKALTAGYTHVQVLPDGIAGWVKAGKKTTSI
jgi:rhodanese-related sulfurtransferase